MQVPFLYLKGLVSEGRRERERAKRDINLPSFLSLTGSSCYSGTGRGYNGSVSVTSSGIPCQPWNSSYPHQYLLYLEGFEELEGGHNYCRNPGNRGDRPWCFTTDRGVRWEYCNVPRCGKSSGRKAALILT